MFKNALLCQETFLITTTLVRFVWIIRVLWFISLKANMYSISVIYFTFHVVLFFVYCFHRRPDWDSFVFTRLLQTSELNCWSVYSLTWLSFMIFISDDVPRLNDFTLKFQHVYCLRNDLPNIILRMINLFKGRSVPFITVQLIINLNLLPWESR